jgi:hypothetical protein
VCECASVRVCLGGWGEEGGGQITVVLMENTFPSGKVTIKWSNLLA